MNDGVLSGQQADLWRVYQPTIRGFSQSGSGITQPVLNSAVVFGEYWNSGQGRVLCRGSIQFASDTTFGSSESVWGVSLPVPANRSSGGADMPIGEAWLWQGSSADPQLNMSAIPTLMDPLLPGGNQSQEDSYFQIFVPYLISYGTGSIATGATSTTVTHGLGETPAAYDIQVVATNAPSTTPKIVYVTNIDSDSFDVNVVSSSATTGLTFGWKCRAEPNASSELALLASHLKPWVWASGHSISWLIEYEARR
jgi:hypothetical protein